MILSLPDSRCVSAWRCDARAARPYSRTISRHLPRASAVISRSLIWTKLTTRRCTLCRARSASSRGIGYGPAHEIVRWPRAPGRQRPSSPRATRENLEDLRERRRPALVAPGGRNVLAGRDDLGDSSSWSMISAGGRVGRSAVVEVPIPRGRVVRRDYRGAGRSHQAYPPVSPCSLSSSLSPTCTACLLRVSIPRHRHRRPMRRTRRQRRPRRTHRGRVPRRGALPRRESRPARARRYRLLLRTRCVPRHRRRLPWRARQPRRDPARLAHPRRQLPPRRFSSTGRRPGLSLRRTPSTNSRPVHRSQFQPVTLFLGELDFQGAGGFSSTE